ncbi:MAG: hypothetical protein L0K86_23980, partial [Actinomycetia bacterium]|nr:hypothetical protein [Actinomycetes bacterium]
MTDYSLRFLARSSRGPDELASDFYGRFDGALSKHMGQLHVSVIADVGDPVRDAMTVVVALHDMGIDVVRVDPDLVDASEIARRLNRSRQNVQQWATGARKSGFPDPISVVGGKRVWPWAMVLEWARTNVDHDEEPTLSLDDAVLADSHLVLLRRGNTAEWSAPLVGPSVATASHS